MTFVALHPGIIPGTRFGRGNAGVDTRPSRAPFGLKSTPAEAEARGGDSPVEPVDAAFAEGQRAAIPPARRWYASKSFASASESGAVNDLPNTR